MSVRPPGRARRTGRSARPRRLRRDQRCEALHRLAPRRGDGDASSAICRSTASSQEGRAGRLLEQPVALAQRLLERGGARRMARIDGEDEAVDEAPRSPGGPLNRPSIAGVIQTRRRCSLKAPEDQAGAPLTRARRTGFAGSAWKARSRFRASLGPRRSRARRRPRSRPCRRSRTISTRPARLRPRPGEKSESASRRLVLPTPFSPESAIASRRTGIQAFEAAEIRESSRVTRGVITRASASAHRARASPPAPASSVGEPGSASFRRALSPSNCASTSRR